MEFNARRPPAAAVEQAPSLLSTDEKVRLFGQMFRGRTDVYPIRWEAKTSGKSGYSPACANEWRPGVCEKPRIKCGDCGHRDLLPLSDAVLFKHLAGEHTIGTYPLLIDDTGRFLAVDFARGQETAPMRGSSSIDVCPPAMPVDWEPHSSAALVPAIVS